MAKESIRKQISNAILKHFDEEQVRHLAIGLAGVGVYTAKDIEMGLYPSLSNPASLTNGKEHLFSFPVDVTWSDGGTLREDTFSVAFTLNCRITKS